jgi:hypothetical protein
VRAAAQLDPVDGSVAPPLKAAHRVDATEQGGLTFEDSLGTSGDDCRDECLLVREVVVELGLADAGSRPDVVEPGAVDPVNEDELVGGLQDAGARSGSSSCQPWGALTLVTGHRKTVSAGPGAA